MKFVLLRSILLKRLHHSVLQGKRNIRELIHASIDVTCKPSCIVAMGTRHQFKSGLWHHTPCCAETMTNRVWRSNHSFKRTVVYTVTSTRNSCGMW